jgi:hypothetical protein
MQATVKEVKPDGVTVVYGSGRSGFVAANLIKPVPEGFDLVTNATDRYGFLAADLTPVPEGIDQVIMPQAAMAY